MDRRFAVVVIVPSLLFGSCAQVSSGEVGVKSTLGVIDPNELQPGIHFFIPGFQTIYIVPVYDLTLDFVSEKANEEGLDPIDALSRDGLPVLIEATVRYALAPDKVAELMIDYGRPLPYTVERKLVIPTVRSEIRDAVAKYKTSEIYSMRENFSKLLKKTLMEALSREGRIEVKDVYIRKIKFPDRFLAAIEKKQIAQQEAERMKYVLEKEKLEAERKKIEAEGIAQAQRIIARQLTNQYLTWKYLEVLKNFAESKNNTIIVAPYDQKLTPLLNVK
ncbi:MAG: prohibitin family protein [Thermotogae bacterium]|nr:prohibitin family protein [Thermotogota bacterium]